MQSRVQLLFEWPQAGTGNRRARSGRKALSAFVVKQLTAGEPKEIVLMKLRGLAEVLDRCAPLPDAMVVVPAVTDQLMRRWTS